MTTETINFEDDKLYTSKEVYEFLKVHKTTLVYYVEKNLIKSVNIWVPWKKRNLRFYWRDIKEFLSSNK